MAGNKKEYDLICSLGGNCAAAHNLEYRQLRVKAYPFDWTYFTDRSTLYKLADGFKQKFRNILLKENLVELPINSAHRECVQYRDETTGIVFANHFRDKIDNDAEYQKVKNKIDRRCKRLLNDIEKAHNILFLFSFSAEIDGGGYEPFHNLMNVLNELYPDKNIEIRALAFDCKKDEKWSDGLFEMDKYQRKMNDYDFGKTNYEWAFLDNVKLSVKHKMNIKLLSLKLFGKKIQLNLSWRKYRA